LRGAGGRNAETFHEKTSLKLIGKRTNQEKLLQARSKGLGGKGVHLREFDPRSCFSLTSREKRKEWALLATNELEKKKLKRKDRGVKGGQETYVNSRGW